MIDFSSKICKALHFDPWEDFQLSNLDSKGDLKVSHALKKIIKISGGKFAKLIARFLLLIHIFIEFKFDYKFIIKKTAWKKYP